MKMDSSINLYQQVSEKIKELIKTEQYREGDKIPNENQICDYFGVSRITVRKAIQQLCDENILIKKHGKGTFISMPTLIDSVSIGGSFSKYCKENSIKSTTKVISKDIIESDEKIANTLKVMVKDKVIRIKRLRLINDLPAIFEIDYFRADSDYIFTNDLENNSLLDIIAQNRNIDISCFSDSFYVEDGTDEINLELECKAGYKYLVIDEIVLSKANEIIYYNEQFIRTDRYKYNLITYR